MTDLTIKVPNQTSDKLIMKSVEIKENLYF